MLRVTLFKSSFCYSNVVLSSMSFFVFRGGCLACLEDFSVVFFH